LSRGGKRNFFAHRSNGSFHDPRAPLVLAANCKTANDQAQEEDGEDEGEIELTVFLAEGKDEGKIQPTPHGQHEQALHEDANCIIGNKPCHLS